MNPPVDVDLINVYVPEASQLSLEAAMVVATQRDQDAALSLEASVLDNDPAVILPDSSRTIFNPMEGNPNMETLIRDLYGDP